MTDLSQRCLVSGAHGHVSVTPARRVILTESAPALGGGDLDRIADDVGVDVALRTLAANGGTAALIASADDGSLTVALTGRVGILIELPTANRFVTPTGTSGHTVHVPGDALRFTVGLQAASPSDLTPNTAATLSTPEGQVASQVVVDLREEASDPTPPAGLEIVDLFAEADVKPEPLPVERQETPAPQPAPPPAPPQPAPEPAAPQRADSPPPPQPAPEPAPVAAAGPGSAAARSTGGVDDESNYVFGIRCPLDHHNHPNAGYCAQCGRKLKINETAVLVKGPRPPLGLFLLDDGGAIPIATDLLIGRDATTHPDVVAGTRQAVLLADTSNVVSRHHLEITLREWSITVTDLGSANGTLLVDAQTGASQPLHPHAPVEMNAGDRLQIGPRTLQLELHHVSNLPT